MLHQATIVHRERVENLALSISISSSSYHNHHRHKKTFSTWFLTITSQSWSNSTWLFYGTFWWWIRSYHIISSKYTNSLCESCLTFLIIFFMNNEIRILQDPHVFYEGCFHTWLILNNSSRIRWLSIRWFQYLYYWLIVNFDLLHVFILEKYWIRLCITRDNVREYWAHQWIITIFLLLWLGT